MYLLFLCNLQKSGASWAYSTYPQITLKMLITDTSHHETIIQTGITCKKILCYMRDSAIRWLIVENAKIFRSYVQHLLIFPSERNCRILIVLYK